MVLDTLETFLQEFIPKVEKKSTQVNQASWLLETTGLKDAADLKAALDTELKWLFHDPRTLERLLSWEKDQALQDPILKRQLNVLIRAFKQNQIPQALLEQIAIKEAALAQSYATFRPEMDGKKLSENDVREILKRENDPTQRQRAWNASKEIGAVLAPQILDLVVLRNQTAHSLGYPDYFQMQLDLQEVDASWLLKTFDRLAEQSDKAYASMLHEIEKRQCHRFGVEPNALGPWAWSDPFAQEDPLDAVDLDALVGGIDIAKVSQDFYAQMGVDVHPILARSDLYERPGKNQHAFCTHIDRRGDVRTLNNVKSSIKWLETVLHELGHAIY